MPHILIRYYTVKDASAARKSTVVGIASIGFFYILTLLLGLGAMTSGYLDPSDSNMAAPLLAKSFGNLPFAVISAIAFTTVLGTVSGLIMAASGAVAHDLMTNFLKIKMNDHQKVFGGKVGGCGCRDYRDAARRCIQGIQRGVSGGMGLQRRGVGKSAVPYDVALLAKNDQGGNHRLNHHRPSQLVDLASSHGAGLYKSLPP